MRRNGNWTIAAYWLKEPPLSVRGTTNSSDPNFRDVFFGDPVVWESVPRDFGGGRGGGECVMVAMMTMPRPGARSFLSLAVESVARSAGPGGQCFRFILLNTRPHWPVLIALRAVEAVRRCERCSIEVVDVQGFGENFGSAEYRAEDQNRKVKHLTLDALAAFTALAAVTRRAKERLLLWMEDDFLACPEFPRHFWRLVVPFAEARMRDNRAFAGVRVSASHGMLLRASLIKHLPAMLVLGGDAARYPLGVLLSATFGKLGMKVFTFRWVLLFHVGEEASIVGTDPGLYTENRFGAVPACRKPIAFHPTIPYTELFDLANCCTSLFSPCVNVTHAMPVLDPKAIYLRPNQRPGNVALFATGAYETCRDVCRSKGYECREVMAPLANSCPQMKAAFNCRYRNGTCQVMQGPVFPAADIWDDTESDTPGMCAISSCPFNFLCHAQERQFARLCPCVKGLPKD